MESTQPNSEFSPELLMLRLDSVNHEQETIKSAGDYMISLDRDHDQGTEAAELWAEVEAASKGYKKHVLCCVADYCVLTHTDPKSKLFNRLLDLLQDCIHLHENNRYFIMNWLKAGLISDALATSLLEKFDQHQAKIRKDQDIYTRASDTEKQFAVYLRNYKQCSANAMVLKEEISTMLSNPENNDPMAINEKINKYNKTLLSMKCNRRLVANIALQFQNSFRQSIIVRLHNLEKIETLRKKVANEVSLRNAKAKTQDA